MNEYGTKIERNFESTRTRTFTRTFIVRKIQACHAIMGDES